MNLSRRSSFPSLCVQPLNRCAQRPMHGIGHTRLLELCLLPDQRSNPSLPIGGLALGIPRCTTVSNVDVGQRARVLSVPVPGRTRWTVFDPHQEVFLWNPPVFANLSLTVCKPLQRTLSLI